MGRLSQGQEATRPAGAQPRAAAREPAAAAEHAGDGRPAQARCPTHRRAPFTLAASSIHASQQGSCCLPVHVRCTAGKHRACPLCPPCRLRVATRNDLWTYTRRQRVLGSRQATRITSNTDMLRDRCAPLLTPCTQRPRVLAYAPHLTLCATSGSACVGLAHAPNAAARKHTAGH